MVRERRDRAIWGFSNRIRGMVISQVKTTELITYHDQVKLWVIARSHMIQAMIAIRKVTLIENLSRLLAVFLFLCDDLIRKFQSIFHNCIHLWVWDFVPLSV